MIYSFLCPSVSSVVEKFVSICVHLWLQPFSRYSRVSRLKKGFSHD